MSRTRLPSGVTTFYTNFSTGNDSNDGTSPSTAFQTLEYALSYVYNTYDFYSLQNNSRVIIQMADNVTDTQGVHFSPHSLVGAQSGDALTIQGGVNSAISVTAGSALEFYYGVIININNVTLSSTIGFGLVSWYGAKVYIDGVKFGACAAGHIQISNGNVFQSGSIYINGTAPYHLVNTLGRYESYGFPIEINANLAFTAFILNTGCGYSAYSSSAINMNGYSVTGQRYQGYFNSVTLSGDQTTTYFPGNVAGSVSYGAQYL